MKVGYIENEWVVRYNDYDGNTHIKFFDTKNEGIDFLKRCEFSVGLMTTRFYDHFVENVID